MPYQECDSEELQAALRLYRRSSDRRRNTLAELKLYLRELSEMKDLKALESLKKLGEFVELAGQVTEAIREPKAPAVMQALGKLAAEIAELILDDIRAGRLAANQAERLRILEESLRLDVEEDIDRREAAQALVDAFWACTERLAPRRLRFALTLQSEGGFLGVTARSELRCEGEAELIPEYVGEAAKRPRRCLDEPELTEFYTTEGEITATMTCHEWMSPASGIQVSGVSHELRGGPLRFRAELRWPRGRPSSLEISWLTSSGDLMLHISGTVVAWGQGQTFTSNADAAATTARVLREHLGTGSLRAEAEPGQPWQITSTLPHASARSTLDITVSR